MILRNWREELEKHNAATLCRRDIRFLVTLSLKILVDIQRFKIMPGSVCNIPDSICTIYTLLKEKQYRNYLPSL